MTLNPTEIAELQGLLFAQSIGQLMPWQEARLRELLARQNPQAQTMSVEDLVKLGLLIVGIYALVKLFSK